MGVVLDQSNKRKEDTAERHTVAAQRNDVPVPKGSRKKKQCADTYTFWLEKKNLTSLAFFYHIHSR